MTIAHLCVLNDVMLLEGILLRFKHMAKGCLLIHHCRDGSGSNPGGDEIFRSSRSVLGPTQPPVKWVPVLSRR